MLSKAVEAFQAALGGMERREAVRFVIGRELPDTCWERQIEAAERVVLSPNAHVGPYLGKCISGRDLYILFGARLPEGAASEVPDLSRTEILTRLDALADDHRLHIPDGRTPRCAPRRSRPAWTQPVRRLRSRSS
jgi:hypothetical protein